MITLIALPDLRVGDVTTEMGTVVETYRASGPELAANRMFRVTVTFDTGASMTQEGPLHSGGYWAGLAVTTPAECSTTYRTPGHDHFETQGAGFKCWQCGTSVAPRMPEGTI